MADNIQNTGVSTSTSSTGGTRSNVVRVFDIVLDASHSIFEDGGVSYNPTLIGMIFYGNKDLDVTSTNPLSLPRALPILGSQKLPLKHELVNIETGPSPDIYPDIGGSNAFNYVYYGDVIPVHGNAVHNALPSPKDLASTTPTSEDAVLASNGTQNQSQPKEIILDDTGNFKPKDDVKNLQPFAGDVILQGRAGQTCRLGTTNKEGANNWSDGDTFGDGLMIWRVGQSKDQQGSTVVEDINGDDSSIYMLSNQKLNNIKLTSTNFMSVLATYVEPIAPTIQLTVAPPPPQPTVPKEPTINIQDPDPVAETSPPPVTSSFSEAELEDPVFAALAEAVDEGLLELIESTFDISEGEDVRGESFSGNSDIVISSSNSNEIYESNIEYSQIPKNFIYKNTDAPLGTKGVTLLTCIRSSRAKQKGIQNYPGIDSSQKYMQASEIMVNLNNVISNCIDPLFTQYPNLQISSGYRCIELNTAITGSKDSEHRFGKAIDFQVPGTPTYQIFNHIVNNNIPYNQLIWEYPEYNKGSWIHISYIEGGNNFNRTIASQNSKLKKALENKYPGQVKFSGTYARYIKINNVPDHKTLIP